MYMKKTWFLLNMCFLLASHHIHLQMQSLTKTWERAYNSGTNYTYPIRLGYERATYVDTVHGVYQFAKLGSGEISIRKYHEQTGILQDSLVWLNNASFGQNFYMDVALTNTRTGFEFIPGYGFGIYTHYGNIPGALHNVQMRRFNIVDPVTLQLMGYTVDSVYNINPPDSLIRQTVVPNSDGWNFFNHQYTWITSITPQHYSILNDPIGCHSSGLCKYQFTANPNYLPRSTSGCAYLLLHDSINNTGYFQLWFSNYYNPVNTLQKSILISGASNGALCNGQFAMELFCDSCTEYEASYLDRLHLSEPNDEVVVLYKKQWSGHTQADYHLLYLNKFDTIGASCDAFSIENDILVGSFNNQGFSTSRWAGLAIGSDRLYAVLFESSGGIYVYCYDFLGNLLWTQTEFVGSQASVAVEADSLGLYLGSQSSIFQTQSGHYLVVKLDANTGMRLIEYVDPDNAGSITDIKISDHAQSIFATGVNQLNGYTTRVIRYDVDNSMLVDEPGATEMVVYPNPAVDQVNIQFKNPGLPIHRVRLGTTDGKILTEFTPNQTPVTIDLSPYPRAVYFIFVDTHAGTFVTRVVKNNE
jgi:hypothetical protein